MAMTSSDHGAFTNKLVLQPIPSPSSQDLPLKGLTFAVKDIFDVEGQVTGFGNPDWARTHSPATSTAPVVLDLLRAGATSIGTIVLDEMAYSLIGENKHYGTPRNPCAADRVPGGSSSGSAVAVGAKLVDFSLGTDTGGSVRVPASYCGIFGFRPSHNVVSTKGVIPVAQSLDTVGWFARDPHILKKVGNVLLQLPEADPVPPSQIIIFDDCFELSTIPTDRITRALINSVEKSFGGLTVKHQKLGEFVENNVPALDSFLSKELLDQSCNIPSLAALSSARRLLEMYEFKLNHAEWINSVNPDLGPTTSKSVREALNCTDEKIDVCFLVKKQFAAALTALLEDRGILVIPTVRDPPPKLQADASTLEFFSARALSLLSIAGLSGFCQVSIPLGVHDGLPVSVSLLARHGSDGFLLDVVETLYHSLEEQVVTA